MMHQIAREALRKKFVHFAQCASESSSGREHFLRAVDVVLDEFLSYELLATEWDADKWGLDPDNWLCDERAAMRRAARDQRPTEAVDA